MISQNLLTCSLFILLLFQTKCDAANSYCPPSACGTIRNISSPFRLNGDPNHCGDPNYELVCENNVPSIYINSHKYYVKDINYQTFTIRAVDVSINTSTCSVPVSSRMFSSTNQYTLFSPFTLSYPDYNINYAYEDYYECVTFLTCPDVLNTSSLLIPLPHCRNASHGNGKHNYMMVGRNIHHVNASFKCTVDFVVPTAWNFTDWNYASLSEIHQSLLYGFQLSWFSYNCRHCKGGYCHVKDDLFICDTIPSIHSGLSYHWAHFTDSFRPILSHFRDFFRPLRGIRTGYLLVVILIAAVVFAGVSIPAKIIIGLGTFYWILVKDWYPKDIKLIVVVSFGVRFIVGFLCGMGFLIYKFRRRHLSMYDNIERFLQSDNKLSPIRYSYSDIKKITRSFREKLGEGGFGSVYKGKLRSGHHVAVKILQKPRENSQDFMNEIATIGRIHHVNVVTLIGYCAERSKRALVFDFMPNGSLDKHIFGREQTNCLDWDTKFKIATEVARGIDYLHCGCDNQILHFDIKPHNILLDDKFVAKISDFGLAKLCSVEKHTVTLTAARGTIGYVAPELINRGIGRVSHKADVYSFGMLLMELVGINRDLEGENDESSKYFPCWIYDHLNQGRDFEIGEEEEIINGDDENNDRTGKLIRKMTIVALWCIQMSPDNRPSMKKALEMLEGEVERLQMPCQSPNLEAREEETWGTCSTDDSASLLHYNNSTSLEIITVESSQGLQQE